MAFFDILREKWISCNPLLIMLVGFGSAMVGTGTAYVIFPENVGLMGLAFASLIMQPFVAKLLSNEEKREYRSKRWSRKLFADHSQTFKTILLLFFGILIAYAMMGLYFKEARVKTLFGAQLEPALSEGRVDLMCMLNIDCRIIERGENTATLQLEMDEARLNQILGESGEQRNAYGGAVGASSLSATGGALPKCSPGWDCFSWYVSNNSLVLLIVLFLSLFYGSGAMLFLAWNASVWGTVFGFIARESMTGGTKYAAFSKLFIKVFPHTLLEASAYFFAVIAGVVIMKAFLKEDLNSPRFRFVLKDGLVFFVFAVFTIFLAAFVEAYVYPYF
ncbi:MAG: stage II sporulation protein M [Candidatus Micrarchaeota archaeon]